LYYTHQFGSHATLSRAKSWLTELGFAPETIESHADGIPRIAVAVEPSRWSGLEMLINVVERSDPQGWPGLWDVANQTHIHPEGAEEEGPHPVQRPSSTIIGWYPADRPCAAPADNEAACHELSHGRGWA